MTWSSRSTEEKWAVLGCSLPVAAPILGIGGLVQLLNFNQSDQHLGGHWFSQLLLLAPLFYVAFISKAGSYLISLPVAFLILTTLSSSIQFTLYRYQPNSYIAPLESNKISELRINRKKMSDYREELLRLIVLQRIAGKESMPAVLMKDGSVDKFQVGSETISFTYRRRLLVEPRSGYSKHVNNVVIQNPRYEEEVSLRLPDGQSLTYEEIQADAISRLAGYSKKMKAYDVYLSAISPIPYSMFWRHAAFHFSGASEQIIKAISVPAQYLRILNGFLFVLIIGFFVSAFHKDLAGE